MAGVTTLTSEKPSCQKNCNNGQCDKGATEYEVCVQGAIIERKLKATDLEHVMKAFT
jgi:hypothetical protein